MLSKLPNNNNEAIMLMAPEEVYFADGANAVKRAHLSELFVFVDFGDRARIFLQNCGVAEEPSPEKVSTN